MLLAAGAAAAVIAVRVARPLPPATVTLALPRLVALAAGTAPAIPLPPQGSLELDSDRFGTLASDAATTVRPIGSVAKTMTALEVVSDRPLAPGADGPVYVITATDVALWQQTLAENGSNVPVTAGERFTERQLLLALMLPSANNIAETLARWISGTRDAFLARLNARAAALGMHGTHFADPSGLSPETVSTAHDLVLLGRAALAEPALAAVVATRDATLPDGTSIHNLDADLAFAPGWLGIKTGETPQAGACLLFAARQRFGDGAAVTVVGSILGQAQLSDALTGAASAVAAAFAGDVEVRPATALGGAAGGVATAWGATANLVLATGSGGALVVRRGSVAAVTVSQPAVPSAGAAAGTVVAVATARLDGAVCASWQVVTAGVLESPSLSWRLQR